MRQRTPRWWYERGRPAGVRYVLLRPLSGVWSWATARRLDSRIQPVDVGVPVVCVGNLTVGGSGKTPVAMALARLLVAAGSAPHILSRGHGGRARGPLRVRPGQHGFGEVGDEALLTARAAPTWIARDRVAGARAAVAAGAGMIVMDDGHQNPSLAKAVSIVVVDAETRDGAWPFGTGAVVPAGPMREPLAVGLARADVALLVLPADLPAADPDLLARFAGAPVFIARLSPLHPPPSGPQLGFAGIGKPWKMARALKAAGCDLVGFEALGDHAVLGEARLRRLAARAARLGAGLITSEKDWVRLPPAWRDRIVAWPVEATFDDPAGLLDLIARRSGGSGSGV